MTRIKRLAKEGSWIVAGQIAAVAGALVLVRVLTEHLDPAQYGQLALGLTIAGLVNQVAMGGVTSGIGRFYSISLEKGDLWGYLRASNRLMGYATLGASAIALALMVGLFLTGQMQWLGLAAAVLVFSILSGYNSALGGIQNAARQRAIVALHGGMDAWLKIGLAVGVVLWVGSSSTAVVIGYALSGLLVTTSQLYFLRRLLQRHGGANLATTNEDWARQIWLFSWPFSAWGIFTWAQQVSDRWALEYFSSTYDVGAYVVLSHLSIVPMTLGAGMLMNLISPILYQRAGAAKDHARVKAVYAVTRNISILVMAATILVAIASYAFHELIFHLLANERYHGYSYLMPWMVVAGGFQSCHHILGVRISATLKVSSIVVPQIISALVFVSLNMLGAFLGGIEGLVYALLAASFIYFLWMLILSEVFMHRAVYEAEYI